jgi:hypothetical protein
VGRATALTALGALVAADAGGGAVLERVHAASLPGRLLQELADTPPSVVLRQVREKVSLLLLLVLQAVPLGRSWQLWRHVSCRNHGTVAAGMRQPSPCAGKPELLGTQCACSLDSC